MQGEALPLSRVKDALPTDHLAMVWEPVVRWSACGCSREQMSPHCEVTGTAR